MFMCQLQAQWGPEEGKNGGMGEKSKGCDGLGIFTSKEVRIV
jgi:hypothetical protein